MLMGTTLLPVSRNIDLSAFLDGIPLTVDAALAPNRASGGPGVIKPYHWGNNLIDVLRYNQL